MGAPQNTPGTFETAQRRLQDTAFSPSTSLQLPLPKDMVASKLNLTFHGSTQYTFASGSPAAPKESTIDTLINMITVTVNGRIVKSVRPHMLHLFEILAFGQEGERRSSAGASAVTGDLPTADGGFAWGTTTQYGTVRESVQIPFEMILAERGRQGTWLDLRGVSSAYVTFTTGPYSALDTTGAPVTYANQSFVIEANIEEVKGVREKQPFADWKQTLNSYLITAQVTDQNYELNTGNFVAGIGLYVKNGASPSVPADLGVTTIKIMTGNKIIKQTDFVSEQAKMRQVYSCNAPRVSNASRLDGFVYIPLLTDAKNLDTAFDARGLNSLRLVISTHASATYSLTVNAEQHEIVPL